MDVIKKLADQFGYGIEQYNSLEKFDSELSSKLLYINKISEKLRFLSYLKDFTETKYKKHAPQCVNPESCGLNQSLEIVLYGIQQQYDDYFEIIGGNTNLNERPAMNFFTEGQYFDAFSSIKEIIKGAENTILLIDGYINTDTLAFFPSKEPKVKLRLLTDGKSLGIEFQRAIDLYNKQYENLVVSISKNFHDRFLIIDDKFFYHIGASIKDAGNKTFMYSKIEDENVIETIRKKIILEWNNVYD